MVLEREVWKEVKVRNVHLFDFGTFLTVSLSQKTDLGAAEQLVVEEGVTCDCRFPPVGSRGPVEEYVTLVCYFTTVSSMRPAEK